MPNEFVLKMSGLAAKWQKLADRYYYEAHDQQMVDYYVAKIDAMCDICRAFDCVSEVWAEAKKIYDFTNSGREGYTLRDGKIVKVEED